MRNDMDAQIDGRVEADLRWRWQFAGGEINPIPSHAQHVERRSNMSPIGRHRAIIRTSVAGGWTEDVGLRCGPVHVGSPAPPFSADRDIDWRSVEAAAKVRRIDARLRACGDSARTVLWLAYGARPRVGLLQLGPLCNLLYLASAAERAHAKARGALGRMEWLERLSEKKRRGNLPRLRGQ